MKLVSILILAVCLNVNAESYGQKVSLNVKNAPLGEVFKIIEVQTGFHFYYKVELLDKAKGVSAVL
jgi:hypothetical protein